MLMDSALHNESSLLPIFFVVILSGSALVLSLALPLFSLPTEADNDAARGRLRPVTAGETCIFLKLSIVAELPASVWGLLWIDPHCGLQKDIFILFSNMPFIPRPVKGEERRVGLYYLYSRNSFFVGISLECACLSPFVNISFE